MRTIYVGEDSINVHVFSTKKNRDGEVSVTDEEWKWILEVEGKYNELQKFFEKKLAGRREMLKQRWKEKAEKRA